MPAELVEQFPQPRLSIRQRRVMQSLARRIEGDRVMIGLTDVQAQEHAVLVVHAFVSHDVHHGLGRW